MLLYSYGRFVLGVYRKFARVVLGEEGLYGAPELRLTAAVMVVAVLHAVICKFTVDGLINGRTDDPVIALKRDILAGKNVWVPRLFERPF